jgi:hypothetical protein
MRGLLFLQLRLRQLRITVTVHSIDTMSRCGHDAAWFASPASSFPAIRTMSRGGATVGCARFSATATNFGDGD